MHAIYTVCCIAMQFFIKQFMQGPTGCAQMLWRNSLDGYLRQILNARVYDVAVRATVDLLI